MPGPKHATPRRPGNRPDPNGDARKPNRKGAARLAKRQAIFDAIKPGDPALGGMTRPGSQNRNKK